MKNEQNEILEYKEVLLYTIVFNNGAITEVKASRVYEDKEKNIIEFWLGHERVSWHIKMDEVSAIILNR